MKLVLLTDADSHDVTWRNGSSVSGVDGSLTEGESRVFLFVWSVGNCSFLCFVCVWTWTMKPSHIWGFWIRRVLNWCQFAAVDCQIMQKDSCFLFSWFRCTSSLRCEPTVVFLCLYLIPAVTFEMFGEWNVFLSLGRLSSGRYSAETTSISLRITQEHVRCGSRRYKPENKHT